MRFPIFGCRSNPAIDKPILRKKLAYIEELISDHRAFWIDANQKYLGVMLRAKLLLTRDGYERAINTPAGSGFDTSWAIRQSGYAGPLTWQLKSSSPTPTI